MNNIEQLPLHYINNLLELVDSLGGNQQELMRATGIDPDAVESERGCISLNQFNRLLAQSRLLTAEPAIGLLLGNRMTITNHGALGLAAMSSKTVGEAASIIAQFIQVRSPLIRVELLRDYAKIRVRLVDLELAEDVRVIYLEAVMGALISALKFITGDRCSCSLIRCNFAEPDYSSLYQGIFETLVQFNQSHTELVFDESQMDIPILMHDRATHMKATEQCERELQENRDLASRIKTRLLSNRGPFPTLEQMADVFNISSRTLRRKLAKADTSYQQLLDEARHHLAINYLKTTQLSIGEIAFFLGYNDPSNFGRAFKKWEGVSPLAFRSSSLEI